MTCDKSFELSIAHHLVQDWARDGERVVIFKTVSWGAEGLPLLNIFS